MFHDGLFHVMGPLVMGHCVMGCFVMGHFMMGYLYVNRVNESCLWWTLQILIHFQGSFLHYLSTFTSGNHILQHMVPSDANTYIT
jgi:hypothetical protein